MAITETVTIDMTPGGIMPIVYASQYDAGGRILAVSLTDHGTPHTIPDGATVQIRGTKADGKGFAYAGTAEGSTAYFTLQQQMTAAAGDVICEVRITDADGGIIGTANFILRVEPAGLADDTDTSATEIPAIEDAAKSYAERAETAAKKAEEAAAGASAGVSPTVAMEAIDGGTRLTITDKDGEHVADILNGSAGAKGDKGDAGAQGPQGPQGETGADGVSPTVSLTAIDNGTRITITDADGEHTADIQNGATGPQGATGATGSAGADGYSPTVEIAEIDGGKRITITDKTGTHTADIMNGVAGATGAKGDTGATGATGAAGADGYSPTVSITQTDTGATITITDKSGDHTATISNGKDGTTGATGAAGKDGTNGKDGAAATITIGAVTTGDAGTAASVTNAGTASAAVLNFVIPKGEKGDTGAQGPQGETGTTGPAYTLTDDDKATIAAAVLAQMTNAESEAL